MASNPFSMAVDAGLNKTLTAKEYLMKVLGKTSEEADAILAQMEAVGD